MGSYVGIAAAATVGGVAAALEQSLGALGATGFVYSARTQFNLAHGRSVVLAHCVELQQLVYRHLRDRCDLLAEMTGGSLLPQMLTLDQLAPWPALRVAVAQKHVTRVMVTPLPGRDGGTLLLLLAPHADAQAVAVESAYLAMVVTQQVQTLCRAEGAREDGRQFSAREEEVIDFLLAGATNEEMAAALGVAACSVRSYLENVYDKLGVLNQRQAVARLVELGYLRRGNLVLVGMRRPTLLSRSTRLRSGLPPRARRPAADVEPAPIRARH